MANPSITSSQIAIDPVSGVFFFRNSNGSLISSSLNLIQSSNTQITTEDSFEVLGDLIISGNLTVSGSTIAINTEAIVVEDKNIELGNISSPSNITANGGGITLKGTTDKTFNWVNTTAAWTSSENIDLASGKSLKINGNTVLTATTLTANVTGDLTGNSNGTHSGNVTGNLTGNSNGTHTGNVIGTASNALVWTNQRKIFLDGDITGNAWVDGSANVTITTTIASNSVTLGADTTGDYVANLSQGTGITITDNTGEGMTPVIKIKDSYTTDMVSNIANAEANAGTWANTVANTAYSNAVTYINNRTLDDLSGVTISNAAIDDVILYNGSAWVNEGLTISKISEVNISNIQEGQILVWDSGSSKWINSIVPEAPAGTQISTTIGNGASKTFPIQHNLNTTDVVVIVKSKLTYEVVDVRWRTVDGSGNESLDWITIDFSTTPELNEMQVSIYGSVQSTSIVLTGRLDNLTGDTAVSAPNPGEALIFNGVWWTNKKVNLTTDMDDVVITGNATGQFLKFDGNDWINSSIPTISNLDDIGDVSAATPNTNDLLKWSGSVWTPVTPTKSMVALENVDNTTDLNKPVSNAVQTALDLKANANISPTITLGGDLTGNVTLSNLGNATLTATIAANSVELGTDTTGSFVASLVAGTGITLTNNSGENATPTIAANTSYLATRSYVDSFASGVNWHTAVKAATTGNLDGIYDNGTSGVGATLTKATAGSIGTIDSASVVAENRILLKAQTDPKQNGIYRIVTTGNGTVAWQLMRATDFDGSTGVGTVIPGDAVFVSAGSTNANQGFIQTTYGTGSNNAIIINTDDITFTQFTGTAALTAGNGISITGNQLDVGTVSTSRIVVNADTIDLATTGVTANTYRSVTVDTYGRVTSGSNPTTISGYGITDAVSSSLTSGYIVLGNSGGVATGTAISGDVTIASNGNIQISSGVIVNADINASAAIDYSKLALSNSIVNADIKTTAAIDYSKLSISNSVTTTDLAAGAARGGFNSTLNAQTASYTLQATDLAKLVTIDSASNTVVTVPNILSDGDRIDVLRKHLTGEVTITAGSGVTVYGTPGLRLRDQWSGATLVKLATNTWVVMGDLKA